MDEQRERHDSLTAREGQSMCIHWALMNQLYCVPVDMTLLEETDFVRLVRAELGSTFDACPADYIRDRLVGGVRCPFNDQRRHVLHDASHYGFIAAEHGRYWPLDDDAKWEIRQRYRDAAGELWVGDGPFTGNEEG